MAKDIAINGNYTVITEDAEVLFEAPTKDIRYLRQTPMVTIYSDGDRSYESTLVSREDSYTEDIYAWLQTNTGA